MNNRPIDPICAGFGPEVFAACQESLRNFAIRTSEVLEAYDQAIQDFVEAYSEADLEALVEAIRAIEAIEAQEPELLSQVEVCHPELKQLVPEEALIAQLPPGVILPRFVAAGH